MDLILAAFDSLDRIFLSCALIGGALFLIQIVLGMFGHHGGMDGEVDIGGADVSVTDGMLAHEIGADATQDSFRLLSMKGVTSFFLVFGLMGLALHRGSGIGPVVSLLGAFLAGFAMMVVMAKLMQSMLNLQSSGNLDLRKAVGAVGMVYLHIPEGGGSGQVQVDIDNRRVVLDALTEDKGGIKTGDRVEVVQVVGGNTLIVRKI